MKQSTLTLKAAVVIVFLLAITPAIISSDAVTQTAESNNSFAFSLYSGLSKTEAGKNIFISPYSISTAIAMTYEGAGNTTAAQMRQALRFPEDTAVLRAGNMEILADMARKDKGYELSAANSLWPQDGLILLKEFTGNVEKYYGGTAEAVDYVKDRQKAVDKINWWTSKKTNGKISNIVKPTDVNALTRLILVNAIYFKGTWQTGFKAAMTKKSDFYTSENSKKTVDMMNQEGNFRYALDKDTQVIELPYAGKDISMLVALPAGRDISKLEAAISYETFKKWTAALRNVKVNVSLPKFLVRCRYSLKQPLIDMGMSQAFDENLADFSGMTGKKDLYISNVIHASFVEVNEKGTEAAASTAVIMMTKSFEMNETFKADHPFIFFIYDNKAGNILFMGRISDPGETEK